jgi:hypothetical protein
VDKNTMFSAVPPMFPSPPPPPAPWKPWLAATIWFWFILYTAYLD